MADEETRLSLEHEVCVEKAEAMRKGGVETWSHHQEVTATCKQIIDQEEKD